VRLTRPRSAHDRRGETGSALALVPAGFLVLIILAAIAVDSAVAFLGQRQLGDALAAAANDAAASAVSNSSFYGSGRVAIDPAAAATVVCQSMAAQHPNLRDVQLSLAVDGPAIALRATAQVQEIFGRALPGLHSRQVTASASARAEGVAAAPGSAPSSFSPLGC
jgi:Flp pilus assembly protein TadG